MLTYFSIFLMYLGIELYGLGLSSGLFSGEFISPKLTITLKEVGFLLLFLFFYGMDDTGKDVVIGQM